MLVVVVVVVLHAEETANAKALRLELAYMQGTGQRPVWLRLAVGKEGSGKVSSITTCAVIWSTPPAPKERNKSNLTPIKPLEPNTNLQKIGEENVNPYHRVVISKIHTEKHYLTNNLGSSTYKLQRELQKREMGAGDKKQ